ncbi:hypothetical protein LTR93_011372 [Exophiala xenobiotica]|nr:hypothetical protein LTR93_011372 [Exophiala xenobiotica]
MSKGSPSTQGQNALTNDPVRTVKIGVASSQMSSDVEDAELGRDRYPDAVAQPTPIAGLVAPTQPSDPDSDPILSYKKLFVLRPGYFTENRTTNTYVGDEEQDSSFPDFQRLPNKELRAFLFDLDSNDKDANTTPKDPDQQLTDDADAEAKRLEELAQAQADDALLNWDTQGNLDRQQTQAAEDLRAADLVNIRLGWVAFDVHDGKHSWQDQEFNREVKDEHVEELVNSFTLSGCNRIRGDLPILAMTKAEFDEYINHIAQVLGMSFDDAVEEAQNPDIVRNRVHGDGAARAITDLLPLILPPEVQADTDKQPELHAGHHRFVAMLRYGTKRDAEGSKLASRGDLNDAQTRDRVIEKKLYADNSLLRYARVNKTDVKMQNSEGDTFRALRTAWTKLKGLERETIIKRDDPRSLSGFPQWIAYTTGTQLTNTQTQERRKRVLTKPRFSCLADSYCRYMWGRSTYNNTFWGKLMPANMPSWIEFFLTHLFNHPHKLFRDHCFMVSDGEMELLNQCFNWKKFTYHHALLEELFLPLEGESTHQKIKPPTPEEWVTTMSSCVILGGNHAGRTHRHPRFLRMLPRPSYERAFRYVKSLNTGFVISGTLTAHLATSIIPILSSFLHFIYYLYEPTDILPSGNNSHEVRTLDLCDRLRPLCYLTPAAKRARSSSATDVEIDMLFDDGEEDALAVSEQKMNRACVTLLYAVKRAAADWKRGESAIETALAIKPGWRATMNDDQKQSILDIVIKETWMHELLEYCFDQFDLEAMVGIGAVMPGAHRKGVKFYPPMLNRSCFPVCGWDLANKFKSNPHSKYFPRGVRDRIAEIQAPVFEVITTSSEYAEALDLLHEHHLFTQSDKCSASQPVSQDKQYVTWTMELRQLLKLIKGYSTRLYNLGFDLGLPTNWDEVKKCKPKAVTSKLPHMDLLTAVRLDAFNNLSKPKSKGILEAYVQPPDVAKGDEWLAKSKQRNGKGKKSALKINPLEDKDSDDDVLPGPAGNEAPSTPRDRDSSQVADRRKRPAPAGADDSGGGRNTRPRNNPSPTRQQPSPHTPGGTQARPRATPATPFDSKKQVGQYAFRGPLNQNVNTGGIDDDRGNPFLPGNNIDNCNRYHQQVYEALPSSNAKGYYNKMLPKIRQRQFEVASDLDQDNQFPLVRLDPVPDTQQEISSQTECW